MKSTQIIQKLYSEYKELNQIVPRLNWGGCGIFAENLYKTLANLGLKPKLVVITLNSKAMNQRIKGKHYNGYAPIHHIVIKVGSKFIDSEGVYKHLKHTEYKGMPLANTLTLDTLEKWNSDPTLWNPEFNRQHIKTIEDKLKECYKNIEKDLEVTV